MATEAERMPSSETPDLSRPDVATKYKDAAEITSAALAHAIAKCVDGADVFDICKATDEFIEGKTDLIYNKRDKEGQKTKKGVAFPTSVTPNELCGNFSPLQKEARTLKNGDVAKIDLGVHVDGFIAVGAHTVVVGASKDVPVTGRAADVIMAAHTAAEAALHALRPGKTTTDVSEAIALAAGEFKCAPVSGVLSHQLKQHIIDGTKVIASRELPEEKSEFPIEVNDVFAIDVVVSTGEGKTKESEVRTTIFKRDIEQNYKLKTTLCRQFMHEVTTRFATVPFSLRAIEDERIGKMGVVECMRHGLLQPYNVLTEKPGELVAQFKFTALVLPTGTKRVGGLPFGEEAFVKSDYTVQNEELKSILASSLSTKKARKKAGKE